MKLDYVREQCLFLNVKMIDRSAVFTHFELYFIIIKDQQINSSFNHEQIVDALQKSGIVQKFERKIEIIQSCLFERQHLKPSDVKELINQLVNMYANRIINSKLNLFLYVLVIYLFCIFLNIYSS